MNAMQTMQTAAGEFRQLGMVFVGNHYVRDRITGGGRQAHFAQLFSRIGKTLKVTQPTAGDVEALAAAWNAQGAETVRKLKAIAATPSALRGIVKTLTLARTLAKAEVAALDLRHIIAAWRDISGE